MNKKLYRDEYHKVFGGVCSGLADYFDMDVTVVRLLFAFTFFIMGVGFVPYIILWIVLPKKGYPYPGYNNPNVDYTVPPQKPAGDFYTPPYQAGNTYTGEPQTFSSPLGYKPKPRSNVGVITGMVLIIIGAAILADEYNIIPDFDWDRLWPVVLVIVGGALIASGQKTHPWEKQNWQHPAEKPVSESGPETTEPTTNV